MADDLGMLPYLRGKPEQDLLRELLRTEKTTDGGWRAMRMNAPCHCMPTEDCCAVSSGIDFYLHACAKCHDVRDMLEYIDLLRRCHLAALPFTRGQVRTNILHVLLSHSHAREQYINRLLSM